MTGSRQQASFVDGVIRIEGKMLHPPIPHWDRPGRASGAGRTNGAKLCKRLIYIRACQEHFSPSAGGAGLVRGIQPLSP
jgi:hypothetical protein